MALIDLRTKTRGYADHLMLNFEGILDGTHNFTPNIGIGTASPDSDLHIVSTATDLHLESTGANSNARILFENDARQYNLLISGADADKFQLYDSTAAAYRITVDSSGNVGIGTVTPLNTFYDISASTVGLHIDGGAGNARLVLEGDGAAIMEFFDDGASANEQWSAITCDGGFTKIRAVNDAGAIVYNFLHMDHSNGNVGIGTVSPSNILEVNKAYTDTTITNYNNAAAACVVVENTDTTANNYAAISLRASTADIGIAIQNIGTNQGDIVFLADNGGNTEVVRFKYDGKVGIGTTSPEGGLDVASGLTTAENAAIVFGADVGARTRTDATRKYGLIAFPHYTNAEQQITAVNGDSNGTDNIVRIGGGASNLNASTKIELYTAANDTTLSGSVRMTIDSSGIVAMPAVYSHDMNGETVRDLWINSSGELGWDSSSERYKTNIATMEDTSWLYELRPVNFNYKAKEKYDDIEVLTEEVTTVDKEGSVTVSQIDKEVTTKKERYTETPIQRKEYGLIAEEVYLLAPEFTFSNDEGVVEGVHYKRLIPVLINEIQKLKQEIETLKSMS